jgi:hypothetical protein
MELQYDIQINAVIQLIGATETKTWGDWISAILAGIGLILSFILPTFFSYIIYKLQKAKCLQLEIEKYKYGELYKDFVRGD